MRPREFRLQCRNESYSGTTSGFCDGYTQANLVIFPEKLASDFYTFCRLNASPCPLLGHTEVGNPHKLNVLSLIEGDFDLRRDFARYSIYENGVLVESPTNILKHWRPDHVGFLIGCSFSFEAALKAAGLPSRNESQGKVVSMYRTNQYLIDSGPFTNVPLVVSMRPYKASDAGKIYQITETFTKLHGPPIAHGRGAAEKLGIRVDYPDFGEFTEMEEDEVPFFWACGVSAQLAALAVSVDIHGPILAHAPGHMLVTDLKEN